MTVDDRIALAAAQLDVQIEQARQRFEQSLIDHDCPPELLDDARAYEKTYMAAWRARELATLRDELLREAPPIVH